MKDPDQENFAVDLDDLTPEDLERWWHRACSEHLTLGELDGLRELESSLDKMRRSAVELGDRGEWSLLAVALAELGLLAAAYTALSAASVAPEELARLARPVQPMHRLVRGALTGVYRALEEGREPPGSAAPPLAH